MRVSVLILVLLFGIAGAPAVGHAEKVRTNQSTKVYARPGERAKVVLQVKSGQAMTVIDKDGRWLKVRVAGRTGYVARSTVDMPEADTIARNTRRRPFVDGRSRKRGFGGASEEGPSDRVGADAVGDGGDEGDDEDTDDEADADEDDEDDEDDVKPTKTAKTTKVTPKPRTRDDGDDDEDPIAGGDDDDDGDGGDDDGDSDDDEDDADTRKKARVAAKTPVYADPDDESEELFTATPSMVLYPGEKSGKWVEVENEEGDLGYVLSSALEVEDRDEGSAVGGGGASQIDLRVRLGVSYMTQGLRSPGGMPAVPDNYNIGIPAATLALGGGYYRAGSGKLIYGAEGTYEYARATPGVDAAGGAITLHTLNVRGVVGLDLKKKSGMMLLGRAGIRYFSYQVGAAENLTENTAKIPSEINTSPMLGVALAMPRFSNKIGLRFSLDAMLLNLSYKQTKNLEDGASPSAKGAVVGVGFTYRWKPSMDIQATYDLTYAKASFGEKVMDSQRNHPMGGVTRTDLLHAITAGIVKAF